MATTLRCSSVKEILNYEWKVSHERTGPRYKEAVCGATGSKIIFIFFIVNVYFMITLILLNTEILDSLGLF